MSTARMKLSIPRIFELQWLNVPLNVYTTLKILYRVEGGGGGGVKNRRYKVKVRIAIRAFS